MKVKYHTTAYLLVLSLLFSSCDSEPPPPPPPGPEAANNYDGIAVPEEPYDPFMGSEEVEMAEEFVMPMELEPERSQHINEEEEVSPPPVSEELVDNVMDRAEEGDLSETFSYDIGPDGKDAVFDYAQEMPSYLGGESALLNEIYGYIVYPRAEYEANITGKVFLSFVIEKDGSISDVKVEKGVHGAPALGLEAIRAVNKLSKKFNPAKQNGIPVRFKKTIPINFALQ